MHVQEWFNLNPKIARHIFVHDRLSRLSVGPEHLSAAMCMGNSLRQWCISYFPTFRQLKMAEANQQMIFYREQALEEMGVPVADPMQQLAGCAAPRRAAAPAPQLQPIMGMQHSVHSSSVQLSQLEQKLHTVEEKLSMQEELLQQTLAALRDQQKMLRLRLPIRAHTSPLTRANRFAFLFPSSKRGLPLPPPRPPKRPSPTPCSPSDSISDSESGFESAHSQAGEQS
jgi:hypothetical protein